jgi:hypothetical protein
LAWRKKKERKTKKEKKNLYRNKTNSRHVRRVTTINGKPTLVMRLGTPLGGSKIKVILYRPVTPGRDTTINTIYNTFSKSKLCLFLKGKYLEEYMVLNMKMGNIEN